MQVCTASLQKHLLPLDEQKYKKNQNKLASNHTYFGISLWFLYKSSEDMFQMSEEIAFPPKQIIKLQRIWSTLDKSDLIHVKVELLKAILIYPWKIGSSSEKSDLPDQRTPGEEWSASVWGMRTPHPDQWLSKRKKEIRSLIPERKTSLLRHTTNSFLCTRRPADCNFTRGKFYASTDWLSLYPPLSRFKPVQAFYRTRQVSLYWIQAMCFRYIQSSKVTMNCPKCWHWQTRGNGVRLILLDFEWQRNHLYFYSRKGRCNALRRNVGVGAFA